MRSTFAVALGGAVGLASAYPQPQRRAVASFPAGQSWDIVLNSADVNLNDLASTEAAGATAIDIDLFDNEASTISTLKSQNKQVICYFSAGSREDWRDDASKFSSSDYGQELDGWAGENWVNVKSDNVRSIMKERIKLAATKGCTAVDPDNVDGFGNGQDGFGYDKSAYADYVKFLASEAASNGLAMGLKNALDLIPDVIDVIQFAVNEQCHEYNECDRYKPLTDANKAVFSIEYGGNNCEQPAGVNLSILIKPEDQGLNTLGGACESSGETTPSPSTPAPSQSAVVEATPSATSSSGAVQTSAPATKPTPTPTPAPETGDEDGENDGEEEDEKNDDVDEEEYDEDEDEDEDEVAKPWWHRYYKHD